jgi:hypothetical protein
MQILFAISVLCFVAVLWAAIAFARHIKAGQPRYVSAVPASVPSEDYFRERLRAVAEPESSPSFSTVARHFEPEPLPLRTRHSTLNQSAREISIHKQWTMPPQPARSRRWDTTATASGKLNLTSNTALRKPPQAARHGNMELLDQTYFNKDLGDLRDPYEPARFSVNERK